jgi:hypothetical protein
MPGARAAPGFLRAQVSTLVRQLFAGHRWDCRCAGGEEPTSTNLTQDVRKPAHILSGDQPAIGA